ncbi:UDP-N-acetylenolpyruvoylglucosamine reductase [Streptosporangium jomthongense]|uniref:UDP-N-acetylenolpyruvoylglucosamine reductase n=1 Tax=Marinobacter aromaticivorans TaxID=1494078 RepID=A0ABW2ITL8_9GAMM|nr:UDP-N-acetylmuramate dehydrogenase [Marinobacter aromaticivorans]GGE60720.1 UDP-N-acetylenolpyruvoylglucosamine reductase [Streptosporangium jomthongense]
MSLHAELQENIDLTELNTLRVSATARYYMEVETLDDLARALAWAQENGHRVLVLGSGSNLVFAGDYAGLVIRMRIAARYWEQVDDTGATLVLGAGENWHDAVLYAARCGYRGIENLALIPGTAGAAPVQNIGAYGVELCDTLVSVTALDRETRQLVTLHKADCEFAYRDSLFKRQPERFIITGIRLRLSRTRPLQLGYRDLEDYLGETDTEKLDAVTVAEAVMAIRHRKLPDPGMIPNVGSFFKNPVVSAETFSKLQAAHPDVVSYPQNGTVKLAAAWLIDRCGWKGYRNDRVGVHNRQALVLINHSGGTGLDVLDLASDIRDSVRAQFGVELAMEPGIVGV